MAPVKPDLPNPYTRPLMTIPEAGACLGMGRTAAFQAADEGRIPTVRITRSRRVPTARLYAELGVPLPPPDRTEQPEPAPIPHPAVSAG